MDVLYFGKIEGIPYDSIILLAVHFVAENKSFKLLSGFVYLRGVILSSNLSVFVIM